MASNNDWTIVIIIIIVLILVWLLFSNNNKNVNVEGFNGEDDSMDPANLGPADLGNNARSQRSRNRGNNNRRPGNLSNCINPPYLNLKCTLNQLYNGTDIDNALENCTVPAKVRNSCRRVLGSSQAAEAQIAAQL